MFIGKCDNLTFSAPGKYKSYPVKRIPNDFNELKKDTYYIVGDVLYMYMGVLKDPGTIRKDPGIYKVRHSYMLEPYYSIEDLRCFDIVNVDINNDEEIDRYMDAYMLSYRMRHNVMATGNVRLSSTGDVYIPELKDNDDALTRIMKLMIIHKRVIPTNYKNSEHVKDYTIDNLISALNGATASMTINRFIAWCEILELDWSFTVMDNGLDRLNPLYEPLSITNHTTLECDFGIAEKGIFKVPLVEGEDPLKRLIKVCVITKHICLVDYKDKGSTPHLLNNMRSSLKRNGRMMLSYFIYWCEILGLEFELKITDRSDGTIYKADSSYTPDDCIYNIDIAEDKDDDE